MVPGREQHYSGPARRWSRGTLYQNHNGGGRVAGTAEVLKVGHLGKLLKNRRSTRGIGLRAAAAEAGVSFNTLARVEAGHVPDIETFSRLARWVGRSPADFFGTGRTTPESTPDVIETHLRSDSALSAAVAARIAGIVREAYDLLAQPKEIAVACHFRAASTFKPEASELFGELLQQMHDALLNED